MNKADGPRIRPRVVLWLAATVFLGTMPAVVGAQATEHEGEIEGVVQDAATGEPLAGSAVAVVEIRREATTHGDGSFHLTGIAPGDYTLRVERLGYRSTAASVTVGPGSGFVTVELESSPIDISGVVVTAGVTERSAAESLRPVNVVAGEDLQRRLQGTVAATLAAEPGLASSSMGPATARPVIRGLSGDRVLMLEDGARIGDVSSSGADHATAVDPSSARRMEVVRGPAALLYGSNALGGVINVIRDEIPSSVPHHPTGSAMLQTQTVSGAVAGSASATFPLSSHVPLRVEVGGRTAGDLATPVGALVNTGVDTWSGSAGTAWVDDWGHLGGSFRGYMNDYGIPGGFVGGHAEGVRVEMARTSAKLRGVVDRPVGPFRSLEVDGTYTWYRHKEIEPPNILGTFFKRQTVSGDVLARHDGWGPFSGGALGARTSWEAFEFAGSLSTPDSRQTTAALYAFEEISFERTRIEAGLRYDWVRATPLEEDPDSDIGPIRQRTFHAASGSLGLLHDLSDHVAVGASVARAFRTPGINELFSEGPHLAAYSFEVGNPSLGTEVGTGIDLFARFESDRFHAELTGFYNDISGFIYGEETGELSPVLLPIYQFQGNDATLAGFEGGFDWQIAGAWVLDATASYVRGTLQDTDEPLPLIPPLQGRAALEYERPQWFTRFETELAARQDRPGAFETPTDGYAVFNAAAGVRITLGGRLNVLTLSLDNLTDEEYRNHLSRVKEIMPAAGRGLSVTYRVVF